MNKIIQWFKQLNKTKKIVIAFITISFVSIILIGMYNESRIMPIEDDVVEQRIQQEKDKQEESKEESSKTQEVESTPENKVQETQTKQEETKTQKQETTKTPVKKEEQTTSTTPSKQESKPVENQPTQNTQPEVETYTVTVQVSGLDIVNFNQSVTIKKGQSVYDALKKATQQKGLGLTGSSSYIKGIGDLHERDYGPMSGWMYSVNGVSPNKGCGSYILENGDHVKWYYVNANQ